MHSSRLLYASIWKWFVKTLRCSVGIFLSVLCFHWYCHIRRQDLLLDYHLVFLRMQFCFGCHSWHKRNVSEYNFNWTAYLFSFTSHYLVRIFNIFSIFSKLFMYSLEDAFGRLSIQSSIWGKQKSVFINAPFSAIFTKLNVMMLEEYA